MDKQNILIVHNQYQLAGGEDTVAENEGRLFEERGHEVHYYIRTNKEIEKAGLLKKIFLGFSAFFSWRAYRDISRLIKRHHIDVVHVHNTVPLISCSVYYAAKRQHCILVQSVHNQRMLCPSGLMIRDNKVCEDCIHQGLSRAYKYRCYKNSWLYSFIIAQAISLHRKIGSYDKVDAFFVTTPFNLQLLKNVVDEKKIYIKPYFADIQPRQLNDKKRNYYIYISRVEYLKGIYVLLEAFKELRGERLIVLGVGADRDKACKYAQDNHLSNIEFIEWKPKQEMLQLLYDAKALVFPTQLYEGYPMTIVESMALGTPVIGSDFGNVGTIIRDKENGLLFRHDSSEDLREKLQYFSEHTEEARRMESGAQKYFEDNHLPDYVYERTRTIYASL